MILIAASVLLFMCFWGVVQLLIFLCSSPSELIGNLYRIRLLSSTLASLSALFTFLIFLWVFGLKNSSHIAQFAGDKGFEAWKLWYSAWKVLYITNPAALIILGINALIPWNLSTSTSRRLLGLAQVAAILATAFAWLATYFLVPDA